MLLGIHVVSPFSYFTNITSMLFKKESFHFQPILACHHYSKRAIELNQKTNESPVLMLPLEVAATGEVIGTGAGTLTAD